MALPTRRRKDTGGRTPVLVEWNQDLVLLHTASDHALTEGDAEDLARELHAADGVATLLVSPGAVASEDFWPQVRTVFGTLREAGAATVRLVMTGAGSRAAAGPALAARIADAWGMTVEAPDGTPLVVPGGSLFVSAAAGQRGGWWRFRADTEPAPLGARCPAPSWQAALDRLPVRTTGGYEVTQIPAGLIVRSQKAPPARPGDLYHAVPLDPARPTVVMGVPGGGDVPGPHDLAELLAGRPELVRHGVRIAPGGPWDLLPQAQRVADELGIEVEVSTGLPLLSSSPGQGPSVARSVLITANGTPGWAPFVNSVVCVPSPDGTPAPRARLLEWNLPVPGAGTGAEATAQLGDGWQVTAIRAGLRVTPRDSAAHGADREQAVDPEGPVIELGVPGVPLPDSLWPALDRLLASLTPDLCERAVVRVQSTAADGGSALRTLAARYSLRGVRHTEPGPDFVPGHLAAPAAVSRVAGSRPVRPVVARPVPSASADGPALPPPAAVSRVAGSRPVRPVVARPVPSASADGPALSPPGAGSGVAGSRPVRPVVARPVPSASADGPPLPPPAVLSEVPDHPPADTSELPVPWHTGPMEDQPQVRLPVPAVPRPAAPAPASPAPSGPDLDAAWEGISHGRPTTAQNVAGSPAAAPGPDFDSAWEALSRGRERQTTGTGEPISPPEAGEPKQPERPQAPHVPRTSNGLMPEPPTESAVPAQPPATTTPEASHFPAPVGTASVGLAPPLPVRSAPARSVRPAHLSSVADRDALRALAPWAWEQHASAVGDVLSRLPAMTDVEWEAAEADLIALRLYLDDAEGPLGHCALAGLLRSGDDRFRAYTACLASGFRRMPVYRGAVLRGAGVAPGEGEDDGESEHLTVGSLLRDLAPLSAVPASMAGMLPPGPRYLIWSVTGRSVRQVFEGRREEVLFAPGTPFRVLDVRRGGASPLILLRELPVSAAASAKPPRSQAPTGPDRTDLAAIARLDEATKTRLTPAKTGGWPHRCVGPIGEGP